MNEESKKELTISIDGKETHVSLDRQKEILNAHSHGETSWRVFKIIGEFVNGFEFLEKYGKSVSFFGSARQGFDSYIYREAYELARDMAKLGYVVFTGGGPGVMEAANKGAAELGEGKSVGININLGDGTGPTERKNQYVEESAGFDFFFVRKVILSFSSQIYIFFPGGFGTMDELFEMLTLIQTKKTAPIPVILVGKEYWEPLLEWIRTTMYEKNSAINKEDMDMFTLVDSSEEALEFIKTCVLNGKE
ncbi:MAG: TIGR00730 family Rossman fold protein [Candidatus Moranbacteria bacterium]|nr:TIGR00730 family Rossman fold protein [Candidatus Moranbacteria bacterium]